MNKTIAATSQSISAAPLDIMVAQWDFTAQANDELTISEGDRLFILPGSSEEWAHVRHVTGAQADTSKSPSGLVPLNYLGKLEPLSRGSALYQYEPENENCICMKLGQKLDVYMTMGKWMLVKLDVFRGKPGGLGYVPGNYVDVFDGRGDEVLQPSTFKEPPREYCYLCEQSIRNISYFQCTQCRLPNGDPFHICRDCAYRRQALFVHQIVKGDNHLFSRGTLWGGQWNCDQCLQLIDGSASFTCLACPALTCDVFDLCQRCYYDPKVPSHKHRMTQVSAEGKLLGTQASSIPILPSEYESYTCDGCRRDIPQYVLDCKVCPHPRYNLCTECAEFDRATFLHDRWTGGAPHEFRVIDRRDQSRVPPKRRQHRSPV